MKKAISLFLVVLLSLLLVGCDDIFGTTAKEGTGTPVPGNYGVISVIDILETGFTLNWTSAYYLDDRSTSDITYKVYIGEGELSDSDLLHNQYNVISEPSLTSYTATELLPNTLYSFLVVITGESSTELLYDSGTITTTSEVPEYVGTWYTYSGDQLYMFEFTETSLVYNIIEYQSEVFYNGTISNNGESVIIQYTSFTDNDGVVYELKEHDYEYKPQEYEWEIVDDVLLLNDRTYAMYDDSEVILELYAGEPQSTTMVNPTEYKVLEINDQFPAAEELVITIYYNDVDQVLVFSSEEVIRYEGYRKQYYFPKPDILDNIYITIALNDADGFGLAYTDLDEYYMNYNSAVYIENEEPRISEIDNKTIDIGDEVSIYVNFFDELLDYGGKVKTINPLTISYDLISIPGSSSNSVISFTKSDSSNSRYYFTFSPDVGGNYIIEFTIDDGFYSSSEILDISVLAINQGGVNVSFE